MRLSWYCWPSLASYMSVTVLLLMVMPRSRSEIHRVENLVAELAFGNAPAALNEPIGEGRLPVVYMRK